MSSNAPPHEPRTSKRRVRVSEVHLPFLHGYALERILHKTGRVYFHIFCRNKLTGRGVSLRVFPRFEPFVTTLTALRKIIESKEGTEAAHFIPEIVDVRMSDKYVYVFTELLGTTDVFSALSGQPVPVIRTFASRLFHALSKLHAVGIGNLIATPSSIVVTEDGRLLFTNLNSLVVQGVPFHPEDSDFNRDLRLMSPSMFAEHKIDPVKDDVWAAGVLLWSLFAGRLPFTIPSASDATFQKVMASSPADVLHSQVPSGIVLDGDAAAFLNCVLAPAGDRRATSTEASAHKWLSASDDAVPGPLPLSTRAISGLSSFSFQDGANTLAMTRGISHSQTDQQPDLVRTSSHAHHGLADGLPEQEHDVVVE